MSSINWGKDIGMAGTGAAMGAAGGPLTALAGGAAGLIGGVASDLFGEIGRASCRERVSSPV